jgi:pyridoxamine 5'-phosphate oxidase family protein
MSHFSENELAYLASQKLGRLATVDADGQPQNAPVGYRYNADLDAIEISGFNMSKSKKFRNVIARPQVAFVVDDVLPPWQPRAVEIRGTAEAIEAVDAQGNDASFIRVTPRQIIAWGIDSHPYKPINRKVDASTT